MTSSQRAWRRYDRTRADVSEAAALAAVSRAAGTPATYPNLSYYAPRQGQDVTALGAACPSPQAVGDQTECDGLFVIGDVAICVEVKGRAIADPARRGDRARLATEIKKIFGEGARQAQRLEQLISHNHGVWLGDGSWLDLAAVREVRAIVVGLDDFGPLAVALGDLERAGCWEKEACPGSPRCMTLRSSARSSTGLPSSCSGSGACPADPFPARDRGRGRRALYEPGATSGREGWIFHGEGGLPRHSEQITSASSVGKSVVAGIDIGRLHGYSFSCSPERQ